MSENHIPEASSLKFQNEFNVLEKLDSGAFGVVFRVRNKLDGCEYAIKRIKLKPTKPDWDIKIKREVQLLAKLNHRNVVRYYGSWIGHGNAESTHNDDPAESNYDETTSIQDSDVNDFSRSAIKSRVQSDDDTTVTGNDDSLIVFGQRDTSELPESDQVPPVSIQTKIPLMYIQMELCEKRTLRTAIDDELYKNEKRVWRLFRQITVGIAHIHYQKIIHRDLKPANIFLDSNYRVKIGDFGLATDLSNKETRCAGTAPYAAPELTTENATYDQKVDVYSLGVILFEMCNQPLKTGMERALVVMELKKVVSSKSTKMKVSNQVYEVYQVVRWLLDCDPNQRPTSQQLLDSEYLDPPGKKKSKKN